MQPSSPDDAGIPAASFPDSAMFGLDDSDLENQIAQAVAGFDMGAVADQPAPAEPHAVFKPGDLVKGTVLVVSEKDVLLDVGGKIQGLVGRDEFLPGYEPPIGSELNVIVDSIDTAAGLLKLSKKQADVAVLWRDLKIGDIVEGVVSAMNKGGLEIAIKGLLRGFIPASQVDTRFLRDISELFGQTVRCEVTKIDRDAQNLVVSRRKVLEREAAESKARMLTELTEGEVRRGRVRNVTDFGAFVDIGGVDGLLHVSDMSWGRIEKPGDIVKVGDELDVQVTKVNRESGKISLGIKQLRPNPWDSVSQRYSAGNTIKGRVVRHAEFGAFVELEPGVEGLVALSEMSWSRRVRHAREVCQVGDVVDVAVLSVDQEKHRISLSLKQVTEDPWARAAEKYPAGSKLQVKVLRFAEFGAFVELTPGVEGMIHISELSPQRVKTVGDVLKIGQEVEARVLRVDEENHKIALSLRPPPEEAPPAPARAVEPEKPGKPKKPSKPRRGGIDFEWDNSGIKLDPSKYARG